MNQKAHSRSSMEARCRPLSERATMSQGHIIESHGEVGDGTSLESAADIKKWERRSRSKSNIYKHSSPVQSCPGFTLSVDI